MARTIVVTKQGIPGVPGAGGYAPGGTDVAVADGGTGASSAAVARTNLGLGNVDNTSDENKPVSTAQAAALAPKERYRTQISDDFSRYPNGSQISTGTDSASGHDHLVTGSGAPVLVTNGRASVSVTPQSATYDSMILPFGKMSHMGCEFRWEAGAVNGGFCMINKSQTSGPIVLGDFLHFDWHSTGGALRYLVGPYVGVFDGTLLQPTWPTALVANVLYRMDWWCSGDVSLITLSSESELIYAGMAKAPQIASLRGGHCTWELLEYATIHPRFERIYAAGDDTSRVPSGDVAPNSLLNALFANPKVGDGTAGLPAVAFRSDPNTGIYRIVEDNLGIATAGILRIQVAAGLTYMRSQLVPESDFGRELGASTLRWSILHVRDIRFAGHIEGDEVADPAAPAANKGRLYFRDNGAGKTQLAVRFPTGAVQVIATEP